MSQGILRIIRVGEISRERETDQLTSLRTPSQPAIAKRLAGWIVDNGAP